MLMNELCGVTFPGPFKTGDNEQSIFSHFATQ